HKVVERHSLRGEWFWREFTMQRVTNSILIKDKHILLLKKPRRGWYAIPGGKMEQGETVGESVMREYREETGLQLLNPKLRGIFTFMMYANETLTQEWMMFTFVCTSFQGKLTDECDEGELAWLPIDKLDTIPMAEGDRDIFKQVLTSEEVTYGSFSYTEDFDLIDSRFNSPAR